MRFWGQVGAFAISVVLGAGTIGGLRYFTKKNAIAKVPSQEISVDNLLIVSESEEPGPSAFAVVTTASPSESLRSELPRYVQSAEEYLCDVYKRTPVKKDAAGDFSWKDPAAAKRQKMDLCSYAIGGMAPELRTRLAAFGKAADAKGIEWSILSGFRDDWRQSIASGIKAGPKNSKHGGSRATKGYGDGRAADIVAFPIGPLMALVDRMGKDLGLIRPHKEFDPYHVQLSEPTRMAAARPAKVRHAKRHRKPSHRRA